MMTGSAHSPPPNQTLSTHQAELPLGAPSTLLLVRQHWLDQLAQLAQGRGLSIQDSLGVDHALD